MKFHNLCSLQIVVQLRHQVSIKEGKNIDFIFFKKICPASFRETCQWLKFPLNGLQAQSRVSPVVGLLPLAYGPAFPNWQKELW
jgi:hypothetical protein